MSMIFIFYDYLCVKLAWIFKSLCGKDYIHFYMIEKMSKSLMYVNM